MSKKVKIIKRDRVLFVDESAVESMRAYGFEPIENETEAKKTTRKTTAKIKQKDQVVSDESADE